MEVLLCLLMTLLTACLIASYIRRKKDDLPGHFEIPILGHLPFVNLQAPHLTFMEWAKKLGPVFKVNMGGQHLVIVEGYEAVREMLTSPDCSGRPNFFRINEFREGGGFGFDGPTKEWKDLRKATFKGIRSYGHGLKNMNRILTNITNTTLENFQDSCDELFDPWGLIYGHMLRSNTAFTLGEQMEPSEELYDHVAQLDKLAMQVLNPAGPAALLDTQPWLRHLGHPTWKKTIELMAIRQKLWEHVAPFIKEEAASIGHYFWKAQEINPAINETRVKCAIGDMMIAGTMSTTVSAYCLIHVLARLPHIQRRLYKEINRVLGSAQQACLDDLENMPYHKATLLELHRFTSMTPLGLPHATIKKTKIAGRTVEAGTALLGNLYGINHDKDFWNDPESFRPDRFLEDDGQSLLPIDHPVRRRVTAFGGGPRICPGENFANSRIFLLFTAILKQFEIEKDTQTTPVVPYQPWTFKVGLGMEPQHYKIKLTKRRDRSQRNVCIGSA